MNSQPTITKTKLLITLKACSKYWETAKQISCKVLWMFFKKNYLFDGFVGPTECRESFDDLPFLLPRQNVVERPANNNINPFSLQQQVSLAIRGYNAPKKSEPRIPKLTFKAFCFISPVSNPQIMRTGGISTPSTTWPNLYK